MKLYELKERLCKELESYAEEKISGSTLKEIDTLAHAIKNICKIIEAKEEEKFYEAYARRGGSNAGGSTARGGGSYRGGSYAQAGGGSSRGSYAEAGGSYEGGSYARGRGRGARRDSMGRYSRDEEIVAQLRELYDMANDEMQRDSIRNIIQMAESM